MKCSKCGFDNPEDALFCEKCDWKLGETYIPEVTFNRSVLSYVALAVGIVAVVLAVMKLSAVGAVAIGAVGLMLGGYSITIPRLMDVPNKNVLVACSAIGLILSVVAFVYGIYLMV
jgi:hypothetical protein